MKNNTVPIPGEFIREELEARELSQRDLAYILGWKEQAVSQILSGSRPITPEVAKELGKAFDVPAELFANLQKAYDLAQAKEPDPGITQRAAIQSIYPMRDMIKRRWFQDMDPDMLAAQMARFFEVPNPSDVPHLKHAAKKTGDYTEETNPKQLAWLFRVRQIAKGIDAPPYSETKLREFLPTLRYLMVDPEDIRQVPDKLLECGISLVVVEFLPGAKIEGVCFWLSDQKPVIGMSLVRDKIDNFWFTLHHELEHVLRRHGMDEPMIDVDLSAQGNDVSEEETIANSEAGNRCVPSREMDDFIMRKQPYISERDVIGFAKVHQIHPGIVVGQIQSRTKKFDFLNKYRVKVGDIVKSSAICDGWGNPLLIEL